MKRFLVTEEERKHIMKLYETVLYDPRGEETKKMADALNKYNNFSLTPATTGNWNDINYNSVLTSFMKANNISHFTCKKGALGCNDDEEGIVKTIQLMKFQKAVKNVLNIDINAPVLFPVKSSDTQTTGTQTNSSTTTQPEGFPFEYPGDKNYRYAHHQGKWWAKNIRNNKVFDLTLNQKFKSSIDNLNNQFASQIQTSGS